MGAIEVINAFAPCVLVLVPSAGLRAVQAALPAAAEAQANQLRQRVGTGASLLRFITQCMLETKREAQKWRRMDCSMLDRLGAAALAKFSPELSSTVFLGSSSLPCTAGEDMFEPCTSGWVAVQAAALQTADGGLPPILRVWTGDRFVLVACHFARTIARPHQQLAVKPGTVLLIQSRFVGRVCARVRVVALFEDVDFADIHKRGCCARTRYFHSVSCLVASLRWLFMPVTSAMCEPVLAKCCWQMHEVLHLAVYRPCRAWIYMQDA